MKLTQNSRFYILFASLLFSVGAYYFVSGAIAFGQLQIIKLTQLYAFTALILLYFALLIGPLLYTFPDLPFKTPLKHARRAIGVSAFYFAALHASFAFFGQLGGFPGIAFLTTNYLTAVGFGAIALFILLLLAVTSFDWVIKKMGLENWKFLQRFVYIAGLLILFHVMLVGTHYQDAVAAVPQITFLALAFLLLLEAMRLDSWIKKRYSQDPQFNYASLFIIGLLFIGAFYVFLPSSIKSGESLSIHGQHPSNAPKNQTAHRNMPSMQGDASLRFTVGLDKPEVITANLQAPLRFTIFNASTGSPVPAFKKVLGKDAHLIIVDSSLHYFEHIHPVQQGNTFLVDAVFPKDGQYRVYLTYQPLGGIEQEVGFSLNVGNGQKESMPTQSVDTNLTKTVGGYEITLKSDKPLSASAIRQGTQAMTFSLRDAATKQPVTNLKPYIGAFGHMVMINKETYAYQHVHPKNPLTPQSNQTSGPDVVFLPMIYQDKVTPGVYRIFAEFNPNGNRVVSDFTVEIGE